MIDDTLLYGLMGFTHGWARVLTVMSPAGATTAMRKIGKADGVITAFREGELPRFQEQRAGALRRLVESQGIVLLDKADWDTKKAELGSAPYR